MMIIIIMFIMKYLLLMFIMIIMQYLLIVSGSTEVSGHPEEARGAGGQEWARAGSRYCRRHGCTQGCKILMPMVMTIIVVILSLTSILLTKIEKK